MMKTIIVANQKGGSGKSTLTVHLAVAAGLAGHGPVAITDTDPQGTTAGWFNDRGRADAPAYARIGQGEGDLEAQLAALEGAGIALLVVDTAPALSDFNSELFRVADLVLVPLNPTPADLKALRKMLPMLKASGKPFLFVLSRVRPNLKNTGATVMALQSIDKVAAAMLHERVGYADAFFRGTTAIESDPKGPIAAEVSALWTEIRDRLYSS